MLLLQQSGNNGQWGSQDSNAREFYFPLAFNACYGIITTGWFNLVERKELNNTRFTYQVYVNSFSDSNDKAGLSYVAIGKQTVGTYSKF